MREQAWLPVEGSGRGGARSLVLESLEELHEWWEEGRSRCVWGDGEASVWSQGLAGKDLGFCIPGESGDT